MSAPELVVVGLAGIDIVLLLVLLAIGREVSGRAGRLLLLLAAFVLPAAAGLGATHASLERSKRVEFCLSCHEMGPYGESLRADDDEMLPAVHFGNRLVDREVACYGCHTDYAMYGTLKAKVQGLKHMWVHYLGQVPERIALYEPYDTAVCLHCHAGARSFEASRHHTRHEGLTDALRAGTRSCLESGCHAVVHEVHAAADGDDPEDAP